MFSCSISTALWPTRDSASRGVFGIRSSNSAWFAPGRRARVLYRAAASTELRVAVKHSRHFAHQGGDTALPPTLLNIGSGIVVHFGLTSFFRDVYGLELDSRFDDKTDGLSRAHLAEECGRRSDKHMDLEPHRCIAVKHRPPRCLSTAECCAVSCDPKSVAQLGV